MKIKKLVGILVIGTIFLGVVSAVVFYNGTSTDFTKTGNGNYGIDTKFYYETKAKMDCEHTGVVYAMGDSKENVTKNLTLPTVGKYGGSTIVWYSDNESIISNDGIVTQPTNGDRYVTLKAVFTDEDGNTEQEIFTVNVKRKIERKELTICDFGNLADINGGEMPFIWLEENTGRIKSIRGKYADYKVRNPEEAIYSLNALKKLYGFKNPEEEYVFLKDFNFERGPSFKLQQVYKGVIVRDSCLTIAADKEGNIMSITGTYGDIGDLSVTPVSTTEDLSRKMRVDLPENSGTLYVYNKDGEYVLCCEVYNRADGNTYIIQDGTLEVLTSLITEMD